MTTGKTKIPDHVGDDDRKTKIPNQAGDDDRKIKIPDQVGDDDRRNYAAWRRVNTTEAGLPSSSLSTRINESWTLPCNFPWHSAKIRLC